MILKARDSIGPDVYNNAIPKTSDFFLFLFPFDFFVSFLEVSKLAAIAKSPSLKGAKPIDRTPLHATYICTAPILIILRTNWSPICTKKIR